MQAVDVVVVGGGVAGLSVLAALTDHRACLLEREPVIGAHASGRNAAIRRPLEWDGTTARLAARTLELMAAHDPDAFLSPTGLWLAATEPRALDRLAAHAAEQGVQVDRIDRAVMEAGGPWLRGGVLAAALAVEGGGVLDIHGMLAALHAAARAAGHPVHTGQGVAGVHVRGGRVAGVVLDGGDILEAQHVVLAAGAWGGALGEACGCGLPLSPVRRHLVQLRADDADGAGGTAPVVWRMDDEVYLRPEGRGLLASPCDATPWPAEDPPSDPAALELLASKLAATCPDLDVAAVQSHWACLRTFAPDRELVAGPDPRLPGLHWLGGLGGRGMSVAPAVGELVARGIAANFPEEFAALSPARLLSI